MSEHPGVGINWELLRTYLAAPCRRCRAGYRSTGSHLSQEQWRWLDRLSDILGFPVPANQFHSHNDATVECKHVQYDHKQHSSIMNPRPHRQMPDSFVSIDGRTTPEPTGLIKTPPGLSNEHVLISADG
jgi:hypothetical protein